MEELVLFPDREDLLPRPRPRVVPVRAHERRLTPRLEPAEREARRRAEEKAKGLAEIARVRRKLDRHGGPEAR